MLPKLFIALLIVNTSCSVKEARKGNPNRGQTIPDQNDKQEAEGGIINPSITEKKEDSSEENKNKPPMFKTPEKSVSVKAGGNVHFGVYAEDPEGDDIVSVVAKFDEGKLPALDIDPLVGILSFPIPEDSPSGHITGNFIAVDAQGNKGMQKFSIKVSGKSNTTQNIMKALKHACELFKDPLDKEACDTATNYPD